jgi:hypothetical protein
VVVDHRTKSWRVLAGDTVDADETDVRIPQEEIVQGVAFHYLREPRCKLCSAAEPGKGLPHGEVVLHMVDELLVKGASYAGIARAIAPIIQAWPAKQRPSTQSVRRHQLLHLRAEQRAIREIVERHAIEADLAVVTGTSSILTRAAFLEVVRDVAFAGVAAGEIKPSLRDGLVAAKALEEIEREGRGDGWAEATAAFRAMATEVRRELGDDRWAAILAKVEQSIVSLADAAEKKTDAAGKELPS